MYIALFHLSALAAINMRYRVRSRVLKLRFSSALWSVPWVLAEFRHNRIVQSPHENYFNICRQPKEK